MTKLSVIHRAELPIDDFPHGIDLVGDILHAAVRRPRMADVWYKARHESEQHMRRSFQIVATDQPIPIWLSRHHATAISRPDGRLVWHVLENHCPHAVASADPDQAGSVPCQGCHLPMVGDGNGGWIPR